MGKRGRVDNQKELNAGYFIVLLVIGFTFGIIVCQLMSF